LVNIKSIINDIQDSTFPPRIDRINETKELLSRVLKDFDIFNKQYINAALDYIEANNFQEAFKALQNADADKKDANEFENLENEFYLNFMFGGKGKDDEFIQEYTNKLCSAIEKKPNFADLRNDLGIAYLIQCRNLFLKGLSEFRAALSINPEYERAKKNLKLAENDGKGFLILLRAILK
jgi:cell fate (sporulation/competence/biofilm development) regulator YlbF (YheA/YmcA/DUF963 family)